MFVRYVLTYRICFKCYEELITIIVREYTIIFKRLFEIVNLQKIGFYCRIFLFILQTFSHLANASEGGWLNNNNNNNNVKIPDDFFSSLNTKGKRSNSAITGDKIKYRKKSRLYSGI